MITTATLENLKRYNSKEYGMTRKFYYLIESGFEPVIPLNPKIKELIAHNSRYFSLSDLPRMKGICKWCYINPTKSSRHLYCSDACHLSAEIFCYPQRIWSRRFLLTRQNNKCPMCDNDYGYLGKDNFTESFEVDHIIPISKGGTALGSENHQLICYPCHKIKTSKERRGI